MGLCAEGLLGKSIKTTYMKFFHLNGTILREDTLAMTDFETENLFDEFVKFLEDRDYTFFGETDFKDSICHRSKQYSLWF